MGFQTHKSGTVTHCPWSPGHWGDLDLALFGPKYSCINILNHLVNKTTGVNINC